MNPKAKSREFIRWAGIHALWAMGVLRFLRWRLQKENAILVLMLHRVLTDKQKAGTNSESGMIVGAGVYRDMVTHILKHYRMVDITRPVPEFSGDRAGVGLSFDDGWQDNYEPVMRDRRERGVPATIFISPALTGQDNPFWPERVRELLHQHSEAEITGTVEALKKLDPAERNVRIADIAAQRGSQHSHAGAVDCTMSWEQMHALHNEGITFASHTQDHEILTSLPSLDLVDAELLASKHDLEAQFGQRCEVLAYPNGGHSDVVVEHTAATGYRRAFTVVPGAWTRETDPLRIPRLNISDGRVSFGGGFSAAAFEYSVVWRAYRALQRAKAAHRAAHQAAHGGGHPAARPDAHHAKDSQAIQPSAQQTNRHADTVPTATHALRDR